MLLIHSGSRGYGGSILRKYTSESHASLEESTEQMKEYTTEHDRALRWAKANRDLIALRFLSCIEPGEEAWGLSRSVLEPVDADLISYAKAKLQERKVVDIGHNHLERVK